MPDAPSIEDIRRDYHLLFARLGRYKAEIVETGLSKELARADELLCRVIATLSARGEERCRSVKASGTPAPPTRRS